MKKESIVQLIISIIFLIEGAWIGSLYNNYRLNNDSEYLSTHIEKILPSVANLNELGIAGMYIGNGRIVCLPDIVYCQHEVGHSLDDFLGYPSVTEEWRNTVENFIEGCIEEYVFSFFCPIQYWGGVNGNPLTVYERPNGDIVEWGGYSELYASIFEQSRTSLKKIPEPLAQFFSIDWSE